MCSCKYTKKKKRKILVLYLKIEALMDCGP
uniref:Uncharacterized protein n=1 Tax=Rhizophora mucronata TaxID=61149 RepID=A0A2P2P405_RHIMU